jgi:hypothetical protein
VIGIHLVPWVHQLLSPGARRRADRTHFDANLIPKTQKARKTGLLSIHRPAPRRRAGQVLRYLTDLQNSSRAAKIATRISHLIQCRRHLLGFGITATSFHRSVTSTKAPCPGPFCCPGSVILRVIPQTPPIVAIPPSADSLLNRTRSAEVSSSRRFLPARVISSAVASVFCSPGPVPPRAACIDPERSEGRAAIPRGDMPRARRR